jgi:5'-deoxynucleotidase YfbR-like HD superfamily hydrolase
MGKTIQTSEGKFFDFENVEAHDYQISEIAHALSNICRFTGHIKDFYSVAEHCVEASYLVPEQYALEALLHDASEAYLGDVSTHLKSLLPEYKALEQRVEKTIAEQYGLEYPMPDCVKTADMLMLIMEKRRFLDDTEHDSKEWPMLEQEANESVLTEIISNSLVSKSPTQAKREFIERFIELATERYKDEDGGEPVGLELAHA